MNEENQKPDKASCDCGHQSTEPKPGGTRRDFLLKVGVGLNVLAGALIGVPIIGYALSSFGVKMPLEWLSLGPLDNFPEGKTRLATFKNPNSRPWDGQTAELPCWVRRLTGEEFQVFAINCAHLGCPVRWFEESQLFMCPCHGGAYYANGERASGPPPRGLFTYQYKVENGELMIQAGLLPTLADPV